METKEIRFSNEKDKEFVRILRERVKEYFDTNKISRFANKTMKIKTVVMVLLYLIPFGLVVSGIFNQVWINALLWATMGFGMAGIGMGVMHDANHNSYSPNSKTNLWLGRLLYIIGGYADNWKAQHNVLHHSYTNVTGLDEDIHPGVYLRFSPHEKRYGIHKFQHFYAWILYGFMTLLWITTKDFKGMARYHKKGLLAFTKKSYPRLFMELVAHKIIYYLFTLGLPLWFSPISPVFTIIFFLMMHFICGVILGVVFQPAHVMPTSQFPLPDKNNTLEHNWVIHQLVTTTNFSPKDNLFSWFIGGLNYQVEHHLFPSICHVHYPKLSPIVQKTTEEFGLPYNTHLNYFSALKNHAKMLKHLGSS